MPEYLYEPRAFWTVQQLAPTVALQGITQGTLVTLNTEHFRNGGRHPIVLTHILLTGVGYQLQEYDGANEPPTVTADRHNCTAAMQRCQLLLSVPQRYHLSRRRLFLPMWGASQTANPLMRQDRTRPYAANLHGVSRWEFDKPMLLPRNGACEFQLTGFVGGFTDLLWNSAATYPIATILFHEKGGMMAGHSRTHRSVMSLVNPTALPDWGADAFTGLAANNFQTWPEVNHLTAMDFRQQEDGRAGSTELLGFTVHIDQTAHDDEVQNSAVGGVATSPVAALAHRVGCRARSTDGGTKEWWWREGAPLSLVSPTITESLVQRLDQPITLHPGDCIEGQLQVPTPQVVGAFQATPNYIVGVSLTGYAVIEG